MLWCMLMQPDNVIKCQKGYVKISLESVVPKTDNHTYDNGTVTKPATATETGGELRYEF